MKKLIGTFFFILLFANIGLAQPRYGFSYAYNQTKKILYITYNLSIDDFSNCKASGYYGTSTKSPRDCIRDAFSKELKIEAGSGSSDFHTIVVVNKGGENNNYDSNSQREPEYYYNSSTEADQAIRDIIARYRGNDYTLYRISLRP